MIYSIFLPDCFVPRNDDAIQASFRGTKQYAHSRSRGLFRYSIIQLFRYSIIPLFLFLSPGEKSFAQSATVTAVGYWDLANITLEKARQNALDNAKEEALRKAGIPEEFIVMNTGLVSDRFIHFVSYSNSEMKGEIVSYDVLKQSVQNDGNRYFYMVEIRAKVKTSKVSRDLEFVTSVEGIKNSPYQDGEQFVFTIKPNKNCYLHVFWFDEEGKGAGVYPNAEEQPELLEKLQTYSFPRTQSYRARKENKELTENISLVFVFTKKNIPFTEACTFENIQRWTTRIPANERYLHYQSIVITN